MSIQGPAGAQEVANETSRLLELGRKHGHADTEYGKRRWTRWRAAMPLELTKDPADPAASWGVTMQNVSGGGIGFRSKRKLRYGEVVYIREWLSGESDVWVSGTVTYCTESILGFLVGVQF